MSIGDLFSLSGRCALVTGASRGIGRALAIGLAAHGAKVLCAARGVSELDSTVRSIRDAGGEAAAVTMDLADHRSLVGSARAAEEIYGAIDILVNNAGVNFREPADAASPEHFERIVAVNLGGPFFLTQEVARGMVARRRGKIINVGSITTDFGLAQLSVYGATKAAIGQFTKSLAIELGPANVQVNALCPGFVLTSLTEKLWSRPEMLEWGRRRIPAGRIAVPDDMVGAAVFLASAASQYVTGHLLYVDGGFTTGEAWPIPPHGANAVDPSGSPRVKP